MRVLLFLGLLTAPNMRVLARWKANFRVRRKLILRKLLLVARGGFQVGQTAKAREDRRVQSLPLGRGHQLCVSHQSQEYIRVSKVE